MAQYRAIFNNAYFKGLATAAVATMALAAGQAQAADVKTNFEGFLGADAENRAGDFTFNAGDTATTTSGGYLTNLNITGAGASLTFSGSKTDHIHVSNTVSVTSGGSLVLGDNTWGITNSEVADTQEQWEVNPESKLVVNNGTVSITKSQIQLGAIDLTDATVTIATNHENEKDTTGWADNAMLNASTIEQNGKVVEGTGIFNVKGSKSAITLDSGSIINASVFNFQDGKITMQGKTDSGSNAVIRAFGSGVVNFDGTDLAVFQSGNYIGGAEVNFNSSGTTVEIANKGELHISGKLDSRKTLPDAQQAGTINFTDGTLNLAGTDSKLIIDHADTVFNATGGTITNSGTIVFNNKTVNTNAALLKQMIAGKVQFAAASSGSVLDLGESVDLSSADGATGFLQDNTGALNANVSITTDLKIKAQEATLGKAFGVQNLTVDAGILKVTPSADDAKAFTQTSGTLIAANGLTSATADNIKKFTVSGTASAATTLTLGADSSAHGSVTKIEEIEVKGAADPAFGKLNINGQWDLSSTKLTLDASGSANLNTAKVILKDLDVKTNGALKLDNSSLTVSSTVSSADNLIDLQNNSTLSVKHGEAMKEQKNKLNKVKADGTSTLVLSHYSGTSISLADLKSEQTKFTSGGLFKLTDANGNQIAISGETGIDKENNTVDFATASSNAGLADIYDKTTVTNVTSSTALTTTNDWGAAQLKSGESTLNIGAAGSVTLNGVDGKLVTDASGAAASVNVSGTGSILNIQGNGTLKAITAGADQGKVLVGAALTVNENVGSDTAKVKELTLQQNGSIQAKNAYVSVLNVGKGSTLKLQGEAADGVLNISGASVVDGQVIAKNITSASGTLEIGGSIQATDTVKAADDVLLGGSLKAKELTLSATGKTVFVGDEDSSGLLEVQTIALNTGKLLLDPDYTKPTNFAAVTGTTINADEVISLNGDIGVGRNSVLAIGTSVDDAKNIVSRLGYQNGKSLNEKTGAVLVVDNTLQVATGDAVVVDSTLDHAGLTNAITAAQANTSGSFVLKKDSVLVVTDGMSLHSSQNNKPVIEFKTATGSALTLEADSTLAFDTALTAKDSVKLTNATALTTTGAKVMAANGLLSGKVGTDGSVTFELKRDQAAKGLYNTSAPVKEFTLDALDGKFGKKDDVDAGVYYVLEASGHDGGKAVEGTARLAVYGGVVQGTDLAQKAANDAVVERMSRSNPNGSLVFANNAQGGGLWLSPVYKSHESDSFDADGVDYGVDGDLTGLVLGADSTTDSGVRVGGYFNFGSASFDGQGVGDQVSNDADYFGFGLYAGMTSGQFSLLADAGFTQVSNDIEQSTGHKNFSKVKADVDSTAVTLGLRGEYKLNVASVDVTPHLGVRYTRLNIDGYDAKANGHTLATTDFDTMQMFSIPFGVTISKDIAAGAWSIKPVFDLTLTANAGDTDATFNTTFIGGRSLDLTSEAFDSFTYGATVGIDAKYGENFSIGLNTNYVGSSNADEFGVMGNVRYMF